MLKNKTRAHAPEPKMATVEKHAPRNYVAFKNIKNLKGFKEFKEFSERILRKDLRFFEQSRRVQESVFSRGGSELFRQKSKKNIVNYL